MLTRQAHGKVPEVEVPIGKRTMREPCQSHESSQQDSYFHQHNQFEQRIYKTKEFQKVQETYDHEAKDTPNSLECIFLFPRSRLAQHEKVTDVNQATYQTPTTMKTDSVITYLKDKCDRTEVRTMPPHCSKTLL